MKSAIKRTLLFTVIIAVMGCATQEKARWSVHDKNRPTPPVITPAAVSGVAPSDAIVLFDGSDLSAWESTKDGSGVKWKLENGYMQVVAKTGNIRTRQAFGSCQIHLEWATPEVVKGTSQKRGNSGIFLMGQYELQILDSYENQTYADGQAAAIYGQNPPLVNVCRGPGQWQTYDIIFHAPVFDGDKVIKPATITVFQNGVLVQDHCEIKGTTFHKALAHYEPHADKLPLMLQEHGNPIRFRNIWIRPL